ncbi:MAG: SAM-dependent methyltransferase [Saprospirales bacterium]|nr:MAG: SAM-dependent methyltransferase [Saprospirales bacterium]
MKSNNRVEKTGDGFPTIISGKYNAMYHSGHGSLSESNHVFIDAGLLHYIFSNHGVSRINLLEYGFGSGLNAWLTAMKCSSGPEIFYTSIEKHPLTQSEAKAFIEAIPCELTAGKDLDLFRNIHNAEWETFTEINPHFHLRKLERSFQNHTFEDQPDLVYYDAFGPGTQADLWTEKIFTPLYEALAPEGIIVSYCVQGAFRRMLSKLGFDWEKLPGPPGKREMLRIIKP